MSKFLRLLALSLLIISISASVPLMTTATKELEVLIIDVGQGDSALIVTPEGKAVLIDAGETDQVVKVFNALNSRRISTIDVVIATHPHEDHMDGLIDVLEAYRINKILESGRVINSSFYTAFQNMAQRKGVPIEKVRAGMQFYVGSVSFEVLHPSEPLSDDIDDCSVVVRMSYGKFSALFTGDIDTSIEDALVASNKVGQVTLLKVSHHGSITSSSEAFLNKAIPQYAAISVGKDNSYGHPSQFIISRLGIIGASILRTDIHGTITFKTDGVMTSVIYEKNEAQINKTYTPPQFQYVASKNSDVFHYSTCSSVPTIKPANLIRFNSREAAVASGRHPCSICKP